MSTPGNKGRGTQAVAKVAGDRAKLTFARVVVRRNLSSYSERGGSALVRRRIQTPSDAKVLSVVQPEGEVVLGASPPARRFAAGRPLHPPARRQSRPASYGRHRKRCLSGPPLRGGPEGVTAGRQSRPASYGRHRKRCLSGPPLRGGPEGVTAGRQSRPASYGRHRK